MLTLVATTHAYSLIALLRLRDFPEFFETTTTQGLLFAKSSLIGDVKYGCFGYIRIISWNGSSALETFSGAQRAKRFRDVSFEATIIVTTWHYALFVLLAGLWTVYWGFTRHDISPRWSLRFAFLWPFPYERSFFGRETFIKGYRGVTVKRGQVLTIERSSEVISNNPVYPSLLLLSADASTLKVVSRLRLSYFATFKTSNHRYTLGNLVF